MSGDIEKLGNDPVVRRWCNAKVTAWVYRVLVVGLMSGAMIVWGFFLWWLIGRFF